MSEPRDSEVPDGVETVEEDDRQTVEDEESSGEGAEHAEEEEPRRPENWERRAHNAAGQAAREKSRRRAAERQVAELNGRLEALERRGGGQSDEDELLSTIAQLRDDDDDPVGDIARVKQALRVFRARQLEVDQQSGQIQQVERQISALRGAMNESEEDFRSDHDDYDAAANHYRTARTEELRDAGYAGAHLNRKLADDLFGVVRMALEAGLDPAERVYTLAQKRGFKPGQQSTDRRLDTLQRASDTGRTPIARGANGALSWGDVAKLDGAARDKAFAKLRDREKSRKAG